MTTRVDSVPSGTVPKKKREDVTQIDIPLPSVAIRARQLRERRGMTQEAAALASQGVLRREEIAKLETGKNLASTSRMQEGLAKAYRVPPSALGAYLREDITLDDLVSSPDDHHDWTHHGNIESALSYHGDRWSGPTVAAGKSFALLMKDDPQPPEWKEILDKIEASLKHLGLPMRRNGKAERSA